MVEVFNAKHAGGGAGTAVDNIDVGDVVCDDIRGHVDGKDGRVHLNMGSVCAEEVEVIVDGVVLIGAAERDNNEADEGGDGAYHRHEYTCKTACFTHVDGGDGAYRGCSVWKTTSVGRRLSERQTRLVIAKQAICMYDGRDNNEREKFVYLMYGCSAGLVAKDSWSWWQ